MLYRWAIYMIFAFFKFYFWFVCFINLVEVWGPLFCPKLYALDVEDFLKF